MKRILVIIINCSLLIINSAAQDQSLSLQKAYELAQQNYPLIKGWFSWLFTSLLFPLQCSFFHLETLIDKIPKNNC